VCHSQTTPYSFNYSGKRFFCKGSHDFICEDSHDFAAKFQIEKARLPKKQFVQKNIKTANFQRLVVKNWLFASFTISKDGGA